MKKNRVVVRLMGRDYTLLTDQPPEDAQRVARYVDRRMRELAITARASESVVPVRSAMTIADELFRAQEENLRLNKERAAQGQQRQA